MTKPIMHYLQVSAGGSYVPACAPTGLHLKGIDATDSKRGVTCKKCRKTEVFKGFKVQQETPKKETVKKLSRKELDNFIQKKGWSADIAEFVSEWVVSGDDLRFFLMENNLLEKEQ